MTEADNTVDDLEGDDEFEDDDDEFEDDGDDANRIPAATTREEHDYLVRALVEDPD